MPDDLAKATVRIDPDLSTFKDRLRAALTEATQGESVEVSIKPKLDRTDLDKAIAETNAAMQGVGAATLDVKPEVDDTEAKAQLGELDAEAKALGADKPKITPTLDRTDFVTGIAEVDASIQELGKDVVFKIKPQLDLAAFAEAKTEQEVLTHEMEQSVERTEKLGEAEDLARGKATELAGAFQGSLTPAIEGVGERVTTYIAGLGQLETSHRQVIQTVKDFQSGTVGLKAAMEDLISRGYDEDRAFTTLHTSISKLAADSEEGAKKMEGWSKVFSDLKTAGGGVEEVFSALFRTLTQSSSSINASASAIIAGLRDIGNGVGDSEQILQFFTDLGIDAEQAGQIVETAMVDTEQAVGDAEQAISTSLGGAGGMTSIFEGLAGAVGGAASQIGPMVGIIGLITAAVLAAIPAVGALVGVLGGLASAGFVGLAGVGAVVLGLSGDFGKLKDAATQALTEYRAALKPFTEPIIDAVTPIIKEGLLSLIPIGQAAAGAIEKVIKEIHSDIESPGFDRFINWIATNAGPAIETFSHVIINVGQGLAAMGETLQPFTNMVEKGLESLSARFASFGQSNTFKDFVQWLQTNGPQVGQDIEQIGKAAVSIAANLTPIGLKLLNMFTELSVALENTVHAIRDIADPILKVKDDVDQVKGTISDLINPIDAITSHLGPLRGISKDVDLGGMFTSLVNPLSDVLGPLSSVTGGIHALTGLFGSGGPPAKDYAANLDHLATKTMPDLQRGAETIHGDISALKSAFDAGKISSGDYNTQLDKLNEAQKRNAQDQETYNANLSELQTQFGLSRQAAIDMANSIGVDLSTALTKPDLAKFTADLSQQGTQAAVTGAAMANLAKMSGESLSQITTDVNNATTATKTAWSSYGDAITAFSGQQKISGDDIKQFYYEQTVQAGQFVTNIQSAIKAGYDPALISQILQAGPGQASTFLQALVSNEGSGLQTLSQNALNTMSKLGAESVEQSRLTEMAVKANSDKFVGDLSEAMAIDQAKLAPDPTSALAGLLGKYNQNLDQVKKVAREYGITLPTAMTDGIPATQAGAQGQVDTYLHALAGAKTPAQLAALGAANALPDAANKAAPAAAQGANSQLAKFYEALNAGKGGSLAPAQGILNMLNQNLGDTKGASASGKKQGDAAGDGAGSSTKPKDAGTKIAGDIIKGLGDTKGAQQAGEKVATEFLKGINDNDDDAQRAGKQLADGIAQGMEGGGLGSRLNTDARTAARGVVDTFVNVIDNNIGTVSAASKQIGEALPTAINSKVGDTKTAATKTVEAFTTTLDAGKGKAEETGKTLTTAVSTGMSSVDLAETGRTILSKFTSSLSNTSKAKSAGEDLGNAVVSGISSTEGKFSALGAQMVEGLTAGLHNSGALAKLDAAAISAANSALKAASGPAGLNSGSPSKKAEDELGLPFVQGFAQGITNNADLVTTATTNLVSGMMSTATDALKQFEGPTPFQQEIGAAAGAAGMAAIQSNYAVAAAAAGWGAVHSNAPAPSYAAAAPQPTFAGLWGFGGGPSGPAPELSQAQSLGAIATLATGYANSRPVTITSAPTISITVPPGSSKELAATIADQVSKALDDHDNGLVAELAAL